MPVSSSASGLHGVPFQRLHSAKVKASFTLGREGTGNQGFQQAQI